MRSPRTAVKIWIWENYFVICRKSAWLNQRAEPLIVNHITSAGTELHCFIKLVAFASFTARTLNECWTHCDSHLLIRVPNSSLMVFWMFSVHSQLHCLFINRHRMLRATSASAVSSDAPTTWEKKKVLLAQFSWEALETQKCGGVAPRSHLRANIMNYFKQKRGSRPISASYTS